MDKEIENMTQKIAAEIKPRKIVLFGSRAAGTARPESDVDLCVVQDQIPDKSAEFIRIRKILGRVIYPLDLILLGNDEFNRRKEIWGTVQYEIDKKGKVLYERGN
ncbi:hypothetical protein A3J44_06190 [candidate division WOR-1 bacterium RIFCSPHIGHO2_02_FULL_45_12]|nr:MAG: hypothetical protein A3J44_06190 [candidate division WOR-1 bacterium RIFCSPHIGHO2_02_FULL_45_12]